MKNRKSKKRTQEPSPYSKSGMLAGVSRFNIKFDLTQSNLECFIGEKRQIKKTQPKRSQSQKMRKPSEKKKPVTPVTKEQVS
jgi:hypothetical protein